MTWKKKIDEIKIICKRDASEMVMESTLNNTNGIYVCRVCGERINLEVHS